MVHQAEKHALSNLHLGSEQSVGSVVKCAAGLAILIGLALFGGPAEPKYTLGEQALTQLDINSMIAAAGSNGLEASVSRD